VEQTALAEAEVEYHDHTSRQIDVRFPVVSSDILELLDAKVIIWTTTPWTIPGNRAISYGPDMDYALIEVTETDEISHAKVGEKLALAEALQGETLARAGITGYEVVTRFKGNALEGTVCAHPWRGKGYDFDVPLLAGTHVTTEAGTGFVHTAPSHGQEDFEVWMANGLGQAAIPDMVDEKGAYYDHVALFAGEQILKTDGKKTGQDGGANKAVIDRLVAEGALLARGRLTHSYPHSWRSKAPLIFRNTPQWFIALDKAFALDGETKRSAKTLRERALAAIDATAWYPAQSINRIRSMIADRPDWLISRQRAWGVPLTLFVHKTTGAILVDEVVNERIARAVTKGGADAWFAKPNSDFLRGRLPEGESARDYEKITDILDVWFDSGSTQAFALEDRGLPWPADVYLEGSDQHRGWFHSSLLE
ncbi:MAG: class I tRNA ligase family protein, partial [Caulobacterales bacterium]|nr:class I tRNA ligase family protein [Caulobacterales bacterium]